MTRNIDNIQIVRDTKEKGGCPYIEHDEWNGDWDCGLGTTLECDQCKYGRGRRDPEAKCNQPK